MSTISNALSSGIEGIKRGQLGLAKAASQIADPNKGVDPQSIVDLKINRFVVEANAKSLSVVSETLGTIIDTKV